MINVALTNLGKYNEGELVYEWLTLPATDEEIEETLNAIGINEQYEEYFITDWECDIEGLHISEYSSLERLNEMAEMLEECGDIELVQALMEAFGYELEEAIENIDKNMYIYLDKNTLMSDEENLAYSFIESIGDLECAVGERISYYFDYESFGRDLRYDLDMLLEDYEEEEKEEIENLSDEELAEWYIEGFSDVSELGKETLERYFDYEKYGRDLSFDFTITSNGIAVSNY